MPITVTTREDINLDAVLRVAWRNDTVEIGDKALQRIAECRASFLKLIESDPPPVIYGVTTAMGTSWQAASSNLTSATAMRASRLLLPPHRSVSHCLSAS
ncbi:aromatic amino acid lyase [Mesorhizobium sp. M0030]|uniref:aromatic amino acid lyase n=1 Tax=Mesorhizobium sp. M0030 TaxID=2956851 RepID=UPI003338D8E1